MLKRFVNACDAIAEWSGRILSIGEYVIMIVMLWQVSARYIFKNPAVWTSDISLYVFGALGVLSGAYLLKHHEHAEGVYHQSFAAADAHRILHDADLLHTGLLP